jgi:hypothetical protein
MFSNDQPIPQPMVGIGLVLDELESDGLNASAKPRRPRQRLFVVNQLARLLSRSARRRWGQPDQILLLQTMEGDVGRSIAQLTFPIAPVNAATKITD